MLKKLSARLNGDFPDRSFEKIRSFVSRRETVLIAGFALVCFCLMLILNISTPLLADDYFYHFVSAQTGDVRIECFADIVESMKIHYMKTNGRLLTHAAVELLLLAGKPLFNVLNSLVYVLFTFLIYKHCKGSSKKASLLLYASINVMLWVFILNYGQTVLWLDGSVNYMWGSALRLAALLPFRLWADGKNGLKNKPYSAILMLILSIAAGMSNENTGAAFIGVSILFIIYYAVKKIKVPFWAFSSLIGSVGGFLFLLLAPANKVRTNMYKFNEPASIVQRFVNVSAHSVLYLLPPAAVGVFLYFLLKDSRKQKTYGTGLVPFIYISGSAGAAAALILSAFSPVRSYFGCSIYMIIFAGCLVYELKEAQVNTKNAVSVLLVLVCGWCMVSYATTYKDTRDYLKAFNEREKEIYSLIDKGETDLIVDRLSTDNPHVAAYELVDLSDISYGQASNDKARYYGVNSIFSGSLSE